MLWNLCFSDLSLPLCAPHLLHRYRLYKILAFALLLSDPKDEVTMTLKNVGSCSHMCMVYYSKRYEFLASSL